MPKDRSRPGAAQEVFEELRREAIPVHILVNCAGFGTAGLFVESDPAAEREMMQLNMVALTELTRLALKEMLPRRAGRILNVASTAAFQPGPRMAVYFATKAYVLSFTEALHEELKPLGVRVSCLCPGPTSTEFGEVAGFGGNSIFDRVAMEAAEVVETGLAGLDKNHAVVVPGWMNKIVAASTRFAPRPVVRKIA